MLFLDPTLKLHEQSAHAQFSACMAMRGIPFRKTKTRLTQRIVLHEKTYFIKQHRGVGWKEILKNLCFGRLPIVSAKNEWLALKACVTAHIPAPKLYGYGIRGVSPAHRTSFVLMEDLHPAQSLEELTRHWQTTPPAFHEKKTLIQEVAQLTRKMHEAGMNHRDLYICHFLLKEKTLYLIDLHRAQIRKRVPRRWRIKDLAALYFSSKGLGLTRQDYLRFIKTYLCLPRYRLDRCNRALFNAVLKRGEKLYRAHQTA